MRGRGNSAPPSFGFHLNEFYNMLTPEKKKEIISALCADIRGVLRYLFHGQGTIRGKFFEVSDINGGEGDSLMVNIQSGVWQDFSVPKGPGTTGDIIELFKLKYGGFKAGMNEIYSYLNIPRFNDVTVEKKSKSWTAPKKDWKDLQEGSDVTNYLTIDRKIPIDILNLCEVKQMIDERGQFYVFLCRTLEAQLCAAAYTNLVRVEKKGKMKKQEFQSSNPLSILWGIHSFDASQFKFVIITEGQIDAMSWKAQGIDNVVSVPMGTSNTDWVYSSWDWLAKFNYIYLCFDTDAAGEDAILGIAKKIGIEKCKKIELPPKYKDSNDAHQNLFELASLISAAKDFRPERLVSMYDLMDKSLEVIAGGRREDKGIPFCGWTGENTINFNIRPAELTLYTGYAGHGKSALLYQAIASLAFRYEQKVVVASLEENSEQLAVLTAIIAAGRSFAKDDKALIKRIFEIARQRIFFYDFRGLAKVDSVMETAEYAIRRFGCQHFVFDSIAKTTLQVEDNEKMNEFVGKICDSMDQTGAHYHLVAHSRKGKEGDFQEIPTLQEIKGAASLGIQCFNCVTVWRNRPKEAMIALGEKQSKTDGSFRTKGNNRSEGKEYNVNNIRREWADNLLIVGKQKVGGQTGQHDLWYNRDTYSFKRSYHEEVKPMLPELAEDEEDEDSIDID